MIWSNEGVFKFDVKGVSLEGQCIGPAPNKAKTIILLHEGLGSVALWRDFPTRISKETGCGVFVYSRQGYGASSLATLPRPLDYMTQEAQSVLPDVLSYMGFQQGYLLGHSDGASIAALYGGHIVDDRILGIILMAPHFFVETISVEAIKAAREAYESGDLRDRLSSYHSDVDNAFWEWNNAWLNPKFASWNIEAILKDISPPVMAIQGDADEYGTLRQLDSLKRHLNSPLRLEVLKDCGHSPHIQCADEVMSMILQFLNRK
ncbi:MAG: alpha/beta hydrolase [Sneathiella sp.]|nr:alpha/beta hydrolase [Sneathiella sp.]